MVRAATIPRTHEKPAADTVYTVNVTGVLVGGSPQDFQYDVIVFDPDVAGADFVETSTSGPASPVVGVGNNYTVNLPGFAGAIPMAFRFSSARPTRRSVQRETSRAFLAETSPGYDVRVDGLGRRGWRRLSFGPSIATGRPVSYASGHFLFAGTGHRQSLVPQSVWAWPPPPRTARVQISTDGGVAWVDLYTQAPATDGGGEGGFTLRQLPLDSVAGKTFQVRFAYTFPGNAFRSSRRLRAPLAGSSTAYHFQACRRLRQ